MKLQVRLRDFSDAFDAITKRKVGEHTVVQSEDFSPDNQPPE